MKNLLNTCHVQGILPKYWGYKDKMKNVAFPQRAKILLGRNLSITLIFYILEKHFGAAQGLLGLVRRPRFKFYFYHLVIYMI